MPTETKPRGPRGRPMMTVTLSPAAIEMLDALAVANGQSKSAVIEALVRQAAKRAPLDAGVARAAVQK